MNPQGNPQSDKRRRANTSTRGQLPAHVTDTFRGKFESIRLGDRVGLVSGPGEFPREGFCRTGKVYGKVTDQWGRHLRVKMDDFTFETVHGITEAGIGAYLINGDDAEA